MKKNKSVRSQGRSADQIRSIHIEYDLFGYADGSALFQLGNTKVLCAVTLIPGVPHFLRGKNTGWLTAEYSMIPSATHIRSQRESITGKSNGRSVEISRLIGRCLRSVVNLDQIKDHTIVIDCDVLQADGGTRTASITGAYLALCRAQKLWLEKGLVASTILQDAVAAISVGIKENLVLLDLDYEEDASVDADYNFVLTASGSIIEIQGTAERRPVSWELFEQVRSRAIQGVQAIFSQCTNSDGKASDGLVKSPAPLFSLQKRNNLLSS